MPVNAAVAAVIAGVVLLSACAKPAPPDAQQNGVDPGQKPVVHKVFDQPTNVPGKSLVSVTVNYPPGTKSAAHHHAKSAFIMAYVISGAIRSQVEGEPARVYHAGETWHESPGAHHVVSANASTAEPAELLAVFLLDTGDDPLSIDDLPAHGR